MLNIAYFPPNNKGRDFIVGDIHGCLNLLNKLLKLVHFEKKKDRMFSVGDLIDRGSQSLKLAMLIKEPWFYSVVGNHESMMVDFIEELEKYKYINLFHNYILNGGEWILNHVSKNMTLSTILKYAYVLIKNLPSIIVVDRNGKRFNIVHAELIKEFSNNISVYSDKDIDNNFSNLDRNAYNILEYNIIWSRTMMHKNHLNLPKEENSLSVTYCGHNVSCNVRYILSHICLDTGAYMTTFLKDDYTHCYGLTMIEHKIHKMYHANE